MSVYNIIYQNKALEVTVEEGAVEPDVGYFGNGKVAISVEDIHDHKGASIIGEFTDMQIEDIAHEIYDEMGDGR